MKAVQMPSLGADMREGVLVKWLKKVGDPISRGDKLAEIETDKTVVEMEAYHDGQLLKTVVEEGQKVKVGECIAYIGGGDEEIPDEPAPTEASDTKEEGHKKIAIETSEEPRSLAATPTKKASPMARRLAIERGVDLNMVEGSGPRGRITKDDVIGYADKVAQTPKVGAFATVAGSKALEGGEFKLSSMRQAVARVTLTSKTTIPHYYVGVEVDMTKAMDLRSQVNTTLRSFDKRVSVNDLVLKATVESLKANPKWNALFKDDRLFMHEYINLGVAIALEEGLIVPAVLGAHDMDLITLSAAAQDLGKRARNNGLTPQEISDGTFSTSNLGALGVDQFAAVIVPPQSGILAVGAVKPRPCIVDGVVVVRQLMSATMSADHRVGDGAEAAKLLNSFKSFLEAPARLLI